MARTLPPKKKAAAPGAPNGSEGNTDMPATLHLASTSPKALPGESDCPVAALATEAATLVRALYALTDPEFHDEYAPWPVPDLREMCGELGGPTESEVSGEIMSRLRAIRDIAIVRTARSMKGAVFQLYLAAETSTHIEFELRTALIPGTELATINDIGRRADQLLYSACAVFENSADEDLPWLRAHYYPNRMRPSQKMANVIDELKARAA